MKIVSLQENKEQPIDASVITVGNFDGVHKGHELLIKNVVKVARAKNISSVVVTFHPHTRDVLLSHTSQPVLSTLEEKAILLKGLGVDYMACIPFNKKFASMTAEDFVEKVLKAKLKACCWVMGETHQFGKNQQGNKNFSHNSKGKNDIYVVAVKSLNVKQTAISSTQIRSRISEGHIAMAVKMLGHPYLLVSPRISGVKKGTELGFPTFNFAGLPSNKVLPPPGIYAAKLEHGKHKWRGALYFGNCPTFGNRDVHFEFHAFNYRNHEPEPGQKACLWVYKMIRPDKAFKTSGELIKQIKTDIKNIKIFFNRRRSNASN